MVRLYGSRVDMISELIIYVRLVHAIFLYIPIVIVLYSFTIKKIFAYKV
jgi:hypothetical protein